MTYDDERSWRPRPPQEPAGQPEPVATGDADTAITDPDELTTQVTFPEVDAGEGEAADEDQDEDTGFSADEAFAESEPTSDGPLRADDEPEPDPEVAAAAGRRRGRRPATAGGDASLAIFVDSSAIVALVDRDDGSHQAAVAAYSNLLAQGYKLFTTNYVITETYDLLSTGVGPDVARRFLRDSKLAIYHADEQDERRAKRLVLRQTGPHGLSLTDAVSLVVMERLSVADAFAVDPGFLSDAG